MSDSSNVAKSIRDRLGSGTEDRLGKALSELLENPLLTGAISRAFDARERAAQAQEVAMGALNIPSAADIERLTRRLRAVSHRLEGIEDGVDRLDRALTPSGVDARLSEIEAQLRGLMDRIEQALRGGAPRAAAQAAPANNTAKASPAKVKGKGKTMKAPRAKAAKAAKAAGAKAKGKAVKAPRAKGKAKAAGAKAKGKAVKAPRAKGKAKAAKAAGAKAKGKAVKAPRAKAKAAGAKAKATKAPRAKAKAAKAPKAKAKTAKAPRAKKAPARARRAS